MYTDPEGMGAYDSRTVHRSRPMVARNVNFQRPAGSRYSHPAFAQYLAAPSQYLEEVPRQFSFRGGLLVSHVPTPLGRANKAVVS